VGGKNFIRRCSKGWSISIEKKEPVRQILPEYKKQGLTYSRKLLKGGVTAGGRGS